MRRVLMRKMPILVLVLSALAIPAPKVLAGNAPDGREMTYQVVAPDYQLTFSPAMPEPGREVVVQLVSGDGRPYAGPVNWSLSGEPVKNSGAPRANPASFAFTPAGPGSYQVTAAFTDPRGVNVSTTLELVIGSGFAPAGPGVSPFPAAFPDIRIDADPPQPRIGGPATFTFRAAGGIPEGGQVGWSVSGGAVADMAVNGKNNERFSFVPGDQGTFLVKAVLHDAGGRPLAEISLGFIPLR